MNIHDNFVNLSDNDILLNFQEILSSIYHNLVKVYAHSYDIWDEIAENLFLHTVMNTFFWKYRFSENDIFKEKDYMKYEVGLDSINIQNYIRCLPSKDTIRVYNFGVEKIVSKELFEDKILVYKCFGDSVNILTGSIPVESAKDVHFLFTEVVVFDSKGTRETDFVFLNNEDIDFQFVKVIG